MSRLTSHVARASIAGILRAPGAGARNPAFARRAFPDRGRDARARLRRARNRRSALGDEPRLDEPCPPARPRRAVLEDGGAALAAARAPVHSRLASAAGRRSRGSEGRASTRERAFTRLQAPARERVFAALRVGWPPPAGIARPPRVPGDLARAREQLSVVCAGAAEHLVRRARDLHVHAR